MVMPDINTMFKGTGTTVNKHRIHKHHKSLDTEKYIKEMMGAPTELFKINLN